MHWRCSFWFSAYCYIVEAMTDSGPVVHEERLNLAIRVRQQSIQVKLIDGLGRVGDAIEREVIDALRQAYMAGLCDGYQQGLVQAKNSSMKGLE